MPKSRIDQFLHDNPEPRSNASNRQFIEYETRLIHALISCNTSITNRAAKHILTLRERQLELDTNAQPK